MKLTTFTGVDSMKYSKEDIVEDLKKCERKNGCVTTDLLNQDDELCSVTPVKREFGNLEKARKKLNLTQIPSVPKGFEKEFGRLSVISDNYRKEATSYVYCLEFEEKIYYVGSSKNVRDRISAHYRWQPIANNEEPPKMYKEYSELKMTNIIRIRSFDKDKVHDEERKLFYEVARRFNTKEVYGRR
jgi:hypothetical protein